MTLAQHPPTHADVVDELVQRLDAQIVRERTHVDIVGELEWMIAAAQARGDENAELRLRHLTTLVEHEVEYARNLDRGYPIVRRRRAPKGAAIGWFRRHDPITRAARRAAGLSLPDDEAAS